MSMTLQTYDHDGEKNSCWCDACGSYHSGNCPPAISRACRLGGHSACGATWCDCDCHEDSEVTA
jgi:hypothetical protein